MKAYKVKVSKSPKIKLPIKTKIPKANISKFISKVKAKKR